MWDFLTSGWLAVERSEPPALNSRGLLRSTPATPFTRRGEILNILSKFLRMLPPLT